jgi:predicted RNA binding protein YcfA (HicA-like mRNA interferase family)
MACQDVRAILKHFGWTLRRTKGSHEIWGDDGRRLVLSTHSKSFNKSYLKDIIATLGLEATDEPQE